MSDYPLAYHITFGTYGMRLHGDPRGTVSRAQNRYGEPFIETDLRWEREERLSLKFPPVFLTEEQRLFGEKVIPLICQRGGWKYHIAACQPDPCHTLLTGAAEGKAIRKWLKRWLSEELSSRWPLKEEQVWWAECGSVKWIFDEEYFLTAYEYIRNQRTTCDEAQRGDTPRLSII